MHLVKEYDKLKFSSTWLASDFFGAIHLDDDTVKMVDYKKFIMFMFVFAN